MEGELRKITWEKLAKIKEDVAVLGSVLLTIEHAMRTGFHRWDVYEDAMRGLANQACALQEEAASLACFLRENGDEEG